MLDKTQEKIAMIRGAYMRQRFQMAEQLYGSAKHRERPKHEKFSLNLKAVISPAMMRQTDPIFGNESSNNTRHHEKWHTKPRAKAALWIP